MLKFIRELIIACFTVPFRILKGIHDVVTSICSMLPFGWVLYLAYLFMLISAFRAIAGLPEWHPFL